MPGPAVAWLTQAATPKHPKRPYQALWGVIQGANYEDLRRQTSQLLGAMPFDGFGIGGALEKSRLGEIIRWVNEELPVDKPKHLLGISEPDDIFTAIANGVDTFDCVSPRASVETAPFTLTRAEKTSLTLPIAAISNPCSKIATATPARTTAAPTCTTSVNPAKSWA